MTRTKQTKPRHIVEDGERNEEPMSVDDNEESDLIVDVETSEENDKVLSTSSEKWMNCPTNFSPSDCDSYEGDAVHPQLRAENISVPPEAYTVHHVDESQEYDSAVDISNSERVWKEENETTQENQLSPNSSYDQLQTLDKASRESAVVSPENHVEISGISGGSVAISNAENVLVGRNTKIVTEHETVQESGTSANIKGEKVVKEYLHPFQNDPVQQQFASIATAQYMNAIKMFIDNGGVSDDGRTDAWRAWTNAAQNVMQQDGANANSSSLVNRYVAQLTETWNNMMMQKFSNQGQLRYHPYHASRSKQVSPRERGNETPESACDKNSSDSASSPVTLNRLSSSPSSENGRSRKVSDMQIRKNETILETSIPNAVDSFSNDATVDKPDILTERNVASDSPCFVRQAPSPLTIPKFPNSGMFQQTTPLSAPALGNNKYLDLSMNSFHYRPWSTSSWLGYPSPQLANFPEHFPYHRRSANENNQFGLPVKSQNKPSSLVSQKIRNDIHRKTSLSSKRSDIFCKNSFPDFSPSVIPTDSRLRHNTSPRRKFSDPTAFLKNADYHNSQFLEEIRHQYKLSHPSFNSPWLNAGLSSNAITSPKFSAMHCLASNKSNPQMFFPSGMHLISPTPGYPLATSVLQTERPSFQGNISYKPDNVLPLSPSAGKVGSSRRSRSRGGPLDSVHAAIVREAKEQFKGLDPENMYIQCPICHKRIKRLYHFQRHMRIHTGEKSHQCPCCQYKSVRKDNLKSHMKTHEKQTIENGRKMAKANFQTNRNSERVNEKGHASSPGRSHQNKPSEFCKGGDSSLTSLPEIGKNIKGSPTQTSQDNLPAPTKEVPNNKRSFPTSHSLNYPMPFITLPHAPKVKEGFLNLPSFKSENLNTSARHQKTQNGDRFMEDRETCTGQADFASSSPRNNFEKSSDDLSEQLKRSYGGREVPQDLSIRNDYEGIPKRQKLPNIEIHSVKDKTSYSLQSNEVNKNNNNDSNREGLAMISKPPYFHNNACGISSASNSNALLSVFGEANIQEKNLENMVIQTQSRFGSGASATLAGFAAAAAAADQTGNDKNPDLALSSGFVAQTSPPDDINAVVSSASQLASAHSFTNTIPTPSMKSGKSSNENHGTTLLEDFPVKRKISETTNVPNDRDMNLATAKNESLSPRFISQLQNKLRDSMSDKSKNVKDAVPKSSASLRASPCDEKKIDESRIPTKGLKCRLCPFNSLSSAELQSHVSSTHKQDGFYKCEKCNYLGKNLSKLVEHIRIHTGERPFKCDQCSYAAKRKDNLGQHKAVRHDKRKNKSSNLYTAIDQINRESIATTTGTTETNSPADRKVNVETNSSVSFSDRFPAFRDVRFYQKMDILSDCPYGKDNEKEKSPSAFAPLTPPFPTFPGMSALPPTVFQYPFHTLPPMFHPSDPSTTMARSAGQNANNPGTYSVKMRAALISP